MSNIAGIIAEYNPFHNGHAWQIQEIKKRLDDIPVVAVMSGHFTQRGEAALAGKWLRAQMAVQGGADLVLELPFAFACRSAEYFAAGGVEVLNATGIVTHLCFGVETPDVAILENMAKESMREDFLSAVKSRMKSGCTYARAVAEIFAARLDVPETLSRGPNNILAVEYFKALYASSSAMRPLAIERQNAAHLDTKIHSFIASATAIRKEILENGFSPETRQTLPESSNKLLLSAIENCQLLLNSATLEKLVFYRLRQLSGEDMKQLCEVSEGLEQRIKKTAYATAALPDFFAKTASKRYPATRIARILTQLLVLDKKDALSVKKPPYIRVLAFNSRGRQLIKKIRSETAFPLIDNLPAHLAAGGLSVEAKTCLDADIKATDIYQLLLGNNKAGLDYLTHPVYVS